MPSWETLLNSVVAFCMGAGLKIIISILILCVGLYLIKLFIKMFKREDKFTLIDESVKSFLASFFNIALKIVLFITIAAYLGLPMTSVVAVLGSVAVAIGLSLQGSLSNFAGGMMIVIFQPFEVDDYIETGSHSGTVTDIGIFYTKLKTLDMKTVILPNGVLANQNITNYSDTDVRRVDFEIGVGYESDPEKVKKVLTDIALGFENVHKDPFPFVGLKGYGDSSVNFTLRVWCDTAEYWNVYFAINEAIIKKFREENIEIPFPQMDVHMK
ncbi:MAG: mechanosensitive ion channel [Clostridia bacterium]|nr:mechanosensitive ion channel [Clostridia bacterium]